MGTQAKIPWVPDGGTRIRRGGPITSWGSARVLVVTVAATLAVVGGFGIYEVRNPSSMAVAAAPVVEALGELRSSEVVALSGTITKSIIERPIALGAPPGIRWADGMVEEPTVDAYFAEPGAALRWAASGPIRTGALCNVMVGEVVDPSLMLDHDVAVLSDDVKAGLATAFVVVTECDS